MLRLDSVSRLSFQHFTFVSVEFGIRQSFEIKQKVRQLKKKVKMIRVDSVCLLFVNLNKERK